LNGQEWYDYGTIFKRSFRRIALVVSFLVGFAVGIGFLSNDAYLNQAQESLSDLRWEALATPGIWIDTLPFIVLPGHFPGVRGTWELMIAPFNGIGYCGIVGVLLWVAERILRVKNSN
jgi:hypothetical protein